VTLVFRCQRPPRNSTQVNPSGGTKCRWGGSKSATFHKQPAISRKRYKIEAWFLLTSNRKSYALYRMVTLPMTLSAPYLPQTTLFSAFCTSILSVVTVTGEPSPRDFKFGTLTYHSKSHPADEKYSLKGAWSGSGDSF